MPGYDAWKTRSPDDDVSSEEPSHEQQRMDYEDEQMNKTVKLDIPDAQTRARLSVIRNILDELIDHGLTLDQAINALNDLVRAEVAHATGRTAAGNDIGGI
jgi:hypothetical protein